MRSLEGKIAVIAGGSKGIGAGVALALAREGCDIALIARRTGLLDAVAERIRTTGRKAIVCTADLAKLDETQRIYANANEPKQLWVIPGARHVNFYRVAPSDYEQRVLRFFSDRLAN